MIKYIAIFTIGYSLGFLSLILIEMISLMIKDAKEKKAIEKKVKNETKKRR
ncbi:MAG: hypothetical protein VZR33_02415 [Methanosphaera sp.]|nr:hypothetical protein [Methanosphaera sp.]